jgi:hypothetical protein
MTGNDNLQDLEEDYNTVTCRRGGCEGFGLDEWMYCILYIFNSGQQVAQRYRYCTHFTVHRYTRSRILSRH